VSSVLVDSSVLLDVLGGDGVWVRWSSQALAAAADTARIVINPVIYAEVSVRYSRIEDLEAAMPVRLFDREPIPYPAAFLAAKAFVLYRRRGGVRSSPLPEFFIGAHAAVSGYRLLTRDAARFRSCFSSLALIAPDEQR
jgi:predicted nucleic acid-binding protein